MGVGTSKIPGTNRFNPIAMRRDSSIERIFSRVVEDLTVADPVSLVLASAKIHVWSPAFDANAKCPHHHAVANDDDFFV